MVPAEPVPFGGIGPHRMIGTDQDPVGSHGGVIGIIFFEIVITRFIKSRSAIGIDHAEIRIQSHGFGQRIQQLLKIFQGPAGLQRQFHHDPLLIDELAGVPDIVVIGRRVDDGKAGFIIPAPYGFVPLLVPVDQPDIPVFPIGKTVQGVLHAIRIAVLEQDGLAVSRVLARDEESGAGPDWHCQPSQQDGEKESGNFHGFRFSHLNVLLSGGLSD